MLTRDENKKIAEQQQELENIESKVAEIKNSLMEANSKGDAQLIEELQNHLNSLDQRKSELLPDEIDPFLEVKNSENLNNQ